MAFNALVNELVLDSWVRHVAHLCCLATIISHWACSCTTQPKNGYNQGKSLHRLQNAI